MRLIRKLAGLSLLLLFVPTVLLSCSGSHKPQAADEKPKAKEIREEYRKGPLCVRLIADRDSMTIAETLQLTIEAEAAEGFEAELPRFGDKLGEFGIRDYREDPPKLTANGKIATRKSYSLEPFLSGDYTIAPMQVRFRKKADAGGGTGSVSKDDNYGEHEISTEAITIKVASLLDGDQKDRTLNPIRGPIELPPEPLSPRLLLALGASAIAAVGLFFFLRRKRASEGVSASPALPAHELAFGRLQSILDEKLVEQGLVKLFFSKVSDVLRTYIENRFGIHAPTRTTEEFLSDISRDAPFSADQKGLLMEFLQDCDLVKFAEHNPSDRQIAKAVDSCRAFIEATRENAE